MNLRDLLEPLERPLLGFDLETTGTNKKTARIVEIGLEIMAPGQPTREYRTLVNPTIPIPPGATKIHGITDEDVKDAPTFAQLAPSLIKGFTGADFVGYNIRFDVERIQQEFGRCGIAWSFEDARLIDGHRLWQIAQPRSLEDFAKAFMDEDARAAASSGAHNALGDVRWSTGGIAGLLTCYPVAMPQRTVAELHTLCWPDWYDAEGKLRWRDGQLCLGFGEHRELPLGEVPAGYLNFILRKDFSDKVKDAVRMFKAGTPIPCPAHLKDTNEDLPS